MININRFLQKSYELQQKQYELDTLSSKMKHEKVSNTSHSQYISEEQTLQQDQIFQSQSITENRAVHSFPLKINQVQQTEQINYDSNNFCSQQAQSSGSNMMASCAQFTFRNQNGSQKKIQSPALQSPIPPSTQSFSENTFQNNIIMNNLMTQNSLNFNKERKQQFQAAPQTFQNLQNIHHEDIELEDNNYTPISYNISSNLKWDYTASKTSQLQASSLQSQCLVDESAFSKQQINQPLLTEIPHYPMMEKAGGLEQNWNRLSEIPLKNYDQSFESKCSPQHPFNGGYSPSKISDLSCLKIENMNPQYIENNVLVTNQWENNPQSTNLTMNSIMNGGLLNFHINLNNNKQQQIEPNNRYNNLQSSCNEQDLFEQIPVDNITSHVVKNFESMESSISYNHSASIISDALQENQQKNTSLKQEIENIINSTRQNTNQLALEQNKNNNNINNNGDYKKEEPHPTKTDLNFYQQQSSHFASSHTSSNSQLQEQKNQQTFKQDSNIQKEVFANNFHQISEFDKENQEINYNYEPKSNRNYQISVSTASSSDQFTHRQKQDTLRKLLSPQGHQELMSQFLGSSQTLSHFENNKQQFIPTDEFFQKSRQQLDSTRNNPNNILNILNKSRDMSPINQNSSGSKRIVINQSMANLQSLISSTRNTQTKQINLNYTPSNNTQFSDKKQKIPKLSINISQVDLKSSQTEFAKPSASPNRLGQSQSTKNILGSSRSGSNLRGTKQVTEGEEYKQYQISSTTRNKCISINIAQISNYATSQSATTTNVLQGNKTPQLFKRLNNKSMSNATSITTTSQIQNQVKTNNSISPNRKLQIQIGQSIQQAHHKNTSLSPNSNSQLNILMKQNASNKQKTPKNSEIIQNTNLQNSATNPQRDPLKQYQLVYKPEKKVNTVNNNYTSALMRRSNTQRYLLNNSNNNQNSCLNNSKNNNNQSSFLNKSNELIKKNFQLIQQKNPLNKNMSGVQQKDCKLEKFYKTIDNISTKSGLSYLLSDRNQHKSINLNQQNNNSNINIKNTSSSHIPNLNNDENEQRVNEKLLEENCQQLKFSGLQINPSQKIVTVPNILQTPNSQNQKQILQKCLHNMVQIYCNICNRKSRNNIQQLLSKR